jgi:hypothetical protein
MIDCLPVPAGAAVIERARAQGLRPADAVIVSYAGDTPWDAHHVFCESGRRYRWGWSEDLELVIVVAPGIDATDAFRGCFWPANAGCFTTVIDIERKQVASIVRMLPKPVLWHRADVSDYFPEEPHALHS